MEPSLWLSLMPILPVLALPTASMEPDPTMLSIRGNGTIVNPETGLLVIVGATPNARTIFAFVANLCLVSLSLLLGYRVKTLIINTFRKFNSTSITSVLILLLFVADLTFVICASVMETGMALRSRMLCYSAATICLAFYTFSKLIIYIFFLERARVVRAPFMPRTRDWLWIAGIIIIFGGFGAISVVGYLSLNVDFSTIDGRCRMGLPPKASFPFLAFDVGINFLLTGLFIWLLKPVFAGSGISVSKIFRERLPRLVKRSLGKHDQNLSRNDIERSYSQVRVVKQSIKTLLWKSLMGSILIMLPTVGNMTQLYIMRGMELGWIYLTTCSLDLTWGVVVINWLTINSTEAETSVRNSVMTVGGKAGQVVTLPFSGDMAGGPQTFVAIGTRSVQEPHRAHTNDISTKKYIEQCEICSYCSN